MIADPLLAAIAELKAIPDEEWIDGGVALMAMHLRLLQDLIRVAKDRADSLTYEIAVSMEADEMVVPGLGRLQREYSTRSTWRDDGASERMRDDLARSVATLVALDVESGEVDQGKRNVAIETMRLAYEAIPSFSSLKQAARRRLRMDMGDYRTFERVPTVRIVTNDDLGVL